VNRANGGAAKYMTISPGEEAEPRGREPSIGKSPELPRGRPGPKYDLRPAAGECEPYKRINQKEDPSDFEHKDDPDRHWAFRHETAHDMV
jgi:hypothetical protein